MKWEKKGLIHRPKSNASWNKKYDILPTPYFIEKDNVIRVFFGTTDDMNFGRITFIDIDADNPLNVVYEHDDYVVDLGRDGTFDDCGVVPSSIIRKNDRYYMYTVGFQRTVKTPYMLFAGLLESSDLRSFSRVSESPILPRVGLRCISQGAPCVIFDEGMYKMWHWYATKWIDVNNKKFMDYHIGYAESTDGVSWNMHDEYCLKPEQSLNEFGVARPWVFKDDGVYHMYYSTRYVDKLYRISYAYSFDGLKWIRTNQIPFDVSDKGWDSEMICYPSVLKVKNKLYMFYNGNNNGETGFGYAEMVE